MAPHEVVKIVDILLRYMPKAVVAALLNDFRMVTIDKEYQSVLTRLETDLKGRGDE